MSPELRTRGVVPGWTDIGRGRIQISKNGAIGSVVAVAMCRQRLQGVDHGLQFRDLAFQGLDVPQRNAFDVRAGAVLVVPECE